MSKLQEGYRERTFLELQPYLFAYGAGLSGVAPIATLYQLIRLNPKVHGTSWKKMVELSVRVFPIQSVLKTIQMNLSTPVKQYTNPILAFGLVGILQGGVYGQMNIFFSRQLNISQNLKIQGTVYIDMLSYINMYIYIKYLMNIYMYYRNVSWCCICWYSRYDVPRYTIYVLILDKREYYKSYVSKYWLEQK